eukprot:gene6533-13227_t
MRYEDILVPKPPVGSKVGICGKNLAFKSFQTYRRSLTMSNLAVHVKGSITTGSSNLFYENTLLNAKSSVLEKGISRFDVLRSVDDSDEFLLIEVYNNPSGPDEHKKTSHYNSWREEVAPIMARPRSAVKYNTIFPPMSEWKTDSSASAIDISSYMSKLPWDKPSSSNLYSDGSMFAVIVNIQVTSGSESKFIEATLKNCKASLKEPGVQRFDFLQNVDDPSNFALVEVYNSPSAPADHKGTTHYASWAVSVIDMMACPRTASKYVTMYPKPLHWHRSVENTHFGEDKQDTWMASCGSGLNDVSGHAFSFLGPKILFGRGIAKKEIATALKTYGIKNPLLVSGAS